MEVTIENGKMTIVLPISERASKSGKTTVIASSGGNLPTTCLHNNRVVIVGVNAYITK